MPFPHGAPFVSTGHGASFAVRASEASLPPHYSLSAGGEISCTSSPSVKEASHQAAAFTYLLPPFPPNMYLPKPSKPEGSRGLTASGFGFWLSLPEQSQHECKVVSSCLTEAGHWANTPWQSNQSSSHLHCLCVLAHLHVPVATTGEQKVLLRVQDESFVSVPHYILPILSFSLQNKTLIFHF